MGINSDLTIIQSQSQQWFDLKGRKSQSKQKDLRFAIPNHWFDLMKSNPFQFSWESEKQAMSMGLLSFFFNMGSFKCVHSPNLAYKLGSGEWFDKWFEIYPNHPLILHSQIIINSWLHLSDCQAKISILLIWEKSGIFNSSVIWYPSLQENPIPTT